MRLQRLCALLAVGICFAASGCDDEAVPPPAEGGTDTAKTAASAVSSADALPEDRDFGPDDFVESEESRDPFRDYSHLYEARTPEARVVQRPVKASDFALDQLKLVGILTRGQPSVLLTDPKGFGWILHTGDFIGKAEMVSVGGTDGNEVPINWKVDLIRADRVVFIREDPTRPEIPPTTRVMPLYPEGDPSERG